MDKVVSVMRRYADFDGRASRRVFFAVALVFVLANLAANYLDSLDGTRQIIVGRMGAAELLVTIVFFLPFVSAGARRLHDSDRSGWWLLLVYLPYLGWIVADGNRQGELLSLGALLLGFVALLVMLLWPGNSGPNRFGTRA